MTRYIHHFSGLICPLGLQDLGSIVTFLRICQPLDNTEWFKRMVIRPLKDGDPRGAGILRVSANALQFVCC